MPGSDDDSVEARIRVSDEDATNSPLANMAAMTTALFENKR